MGIEKQGWTKSGVSFNGSENRFAGLGQRGAMFPRLYHVGRQKALMKEYAVNLSDGLCGFSSVEDVRQVFLREGFVCSLEAATTLFLTQRLEKPLLVEGPAGVGKTEIAKTAARVLGLPLIRLQCYEGLDESKALYEWQYGKQLLYSQMLKDHVDTLLDGCRDLQQSMARLHAVKDLFFSESFLEPRPLLRALKAERGAVLLIDEVDKADEEFEAFLLEILSDFQVSIPELGTVRATQRPFVVLTSNSTRELGEALKRRCL